MLSQANGACNMFRILYLCVYYIYVYRMTWIYIILYIILCYALYTALYPTSIVHGHLHLHVQSSFLGVKGKLSTLINLNCPHIYPHLSIYSAQSTHITHILLPKLPIILIMRIVYSEQSTHQNRHQNCTL